MFTTIDVNDEDPAPPHADDGVVGDKFSTANPTPVHRRHDRRGGPKSPKTYDAERHTELLARNKARITVDSEDDFIRKYLYAPTITAESDRILKGQEGALPYDEAIEIFLERSHATPKRVQDRTSTANSKKGELMPHHKHFPKRPVSSTPGRMANGECPQKYWGRTFC